MSITYLHQNTPPFSLRSLYMASGVKVAYVHKFHCILELIFQSNLYLSLKLSLNLSSAFSYSDTNPMAKSSLMPNK